MNFIQASSQCQYLLFTIHCTSEYVCEQLSFESQKKNINFFYRFGLQWVNKPSSKTKENMLSINK